MVRSRFPVSVVTASVVVASVSAAAGAQSAETDAELRNALKGISASTLQGHLSFLASDLLEGRDTPSRGLDLAAQYIAAHYRRIGLTPVGDDAYYQTAPVGMLRHTEDDFAGSVTLAGRRRTIDASAVSLLSGGAFAARSAPVFKFTFDAEGAGDLEFEEGALEGMVVLTDLPSARSLADRSAARAIFQASSALRRAGAELIVSVRDSDEPGAGLGSGTMIYTDTGEPVRRGRGGRGGGTNWITVNDPALFALFGSLSEGETDAVASITLAGASDLEETPVKNVVGLLEGSDPQLKDEYIVVTAHYDHVGMREGEGDTIFNGANDDASGTVALLDIAEALASLETAPKRSILFMTVWGEEKGLLGSRYYARNPIFSLAKTVADINLEMMGLAAPPSEGYAARAFITGHGYSTLSDSLVEAGAEMGVEFFDDPRNQSFYARSDNQAFADAGVPAHTIAAGFDEDPQYHRPGDHWERLDFANMTLVTRASAMAIYRVANADGIPLWHADHPRVERYIEAWRALKSGSE